MLEQCAIGPHAFQESNLFLREMRSGAPVHGKITSQLISFSERQGHLSSGLGPQVLVTVPTPGSVGSCKLSPSSLTPKYSTVWDNEHTVGRVLTPAFQRAFQKSARPTDGGARLVQRPSLPEIASPKFTSSTPPLGTKNVLFNASGSQLSSSPFMSPCTPQTGALDALALRGVLSVWSWGCCLPHACLQRAAHPFIKV
eukprot:1160714-Pelagomonas_calceolata.AAC.6